MLWYDMYMMKIIVWKHRTDGVNIRHAEVIWILDTFRTLIIVITSMFISIKT